MPYVGTPWIRDGQLVTANGERIVVDSPTWFAWLKTATRFCYSPGHSSYRLTARKEKRRHTFYWYGYLKKDTKLHNIYLGKSEQLTRARLDEACRKLLQKMQPGPDQP